MTKPLLLTLAFLLAACGSSMPEAVAHGVSTDPNAAIGFMTKNPVPPATAQQCKNANTPLMCDTDGRPYGYDFLGQRLPDIKAQFLDGTPFTVNMIDRWTVIKVWGVWCGDSMADAPNAVRLSHEIRKDPSLAFLSIHVPASTARATDAEMYGEFGSVTAYFDAKGYRFPTLTDPNGDIREQLRISWTPSYLLVSPDGVVRGFRTDISVAGENPVETFLKEIDDVRAAVKDGSLATGLPSPDIGPNGAVNLRNETVFTVSAIQAAFPGYRVIADRISSNGEDDPVYLVKNPENTKPDDKALYVIWPSWTLGHVRTVSTQNTHVKGPYGLKIGLSRLSDLSAAQRSLCTAGEDLHVNHQICPDNADSPKFTAIFKHDSHSGEKTLEMTAEDRGAARLVEMKFFPELPTESE